MASKHRLHVRRRTGDHLQDVGGRGLPLQRLLRLVEQPRILDGDHGLVGEGLQQLDVMRVKTGRAVLLLVAITPIDVSLLMSGTYNTLRKPRARAISLEPLVRLFGVGDLQRLRQLAPVQTSERRRCAAGTWLSASRRRPGLSA